MTIIKFCHKIWHSLCRLARQCHGSLDLSKEKSAEHHREVVIDKVLYRITSVFEGKKELDTALTQLALRKALDKQLIPKSD